MRKISLVVYFWGGFLCALCTQAQRLEPKTVQSMQKFDRFFGILSAAYIDELNGSELVEEAIRATLAKLDPHSYYLSTEEMRVQNESFQGNFSGIGIEFNVLRDTLFVVDVVRGGPSEQVGVLPNDRIVEIDGVNSVGIKREDAPGKLRGERGTVVELGVVRGGVRLDFRVVRDNIPITAVDAAFRVDGKTGYVRVNRFAQNTMEEFRAAMAGMKGINALILDLRGNGGGYLHMATDMANYFLDKGEVIVSTEGRRAGKEVYRCDRVGEFRGGRVVVLVDELSASASEIVAGALQDWDRAVIVGRRSFGKGLVQQQFGLQDGSAVRVTVSRYLTPTGRAIQRPFQMGHGEEYYQSLAARVAGGDMPTDSAQVFRTLRLGKTVYGGGGITPDFYVAADTTGVSEYYVKLVRTGVIGEFMVNYLDNNRARIEGSYPTFEAFDRHFEVGGEVLAELVELGGKRGVEPDPEGLSASRGLISVQLKASIASRLWESGSFYRVMNPRRDPVWAKAMEILANWDKMTKGIVVL